MQNALCEGVSLTIGAEEATMEVSVLAGLALILMADYDGWVESIISEWRRAMI